MKKGRHGWSSSPFSRSSTNGHFPSFRFFAGGATFPNLGSDHWTKNCCSVLVVQAQDKRLPPISTIADMYTCPRTIAGLARSTQSSERHLSTTLQRTACRTWVPNRKIRSDHWVAAAIYLVHPSDWRCRHWRKSAWAPAASCAFGPKAANWAAGARHVLAMVWGRNRIPSLSQPQGVESRHQVRFECLCQGRQYWAAMALSERGGHYHRCKREAQAHHPQRVGRWEGPGWRNEQGTSKRTSTYAW